jgi:amino acid adenylation domain-containing protein
MAAVTGQEQIVAAVTRDHGGAGFDADALRAALARRLPRYMVPAAVRCLPQLPYTPSGKPNRAALADGAGQVSEPAGALTGSAAEIADLWQSLLGRRPTSVEDDFFAVGGHSLLALRLLDRLAADLGAQLTVSELFAASRLRDLAALVDERRSDATAATARAIPLIPHNPDPTGPATPAQARLWYAEQAAPSGAYNLALRVDFDEPVLPAALDASVSALAARHPTLRTLLAATGDGCGQHVQPPRAQVLRWVELSDATSPDAAGQLLAAVLAADAERPFELAAEHPYRAVAVSLAPDRHVLQLTFHHSAVDGLSIPILRHDLAEGYRLASRGCAPVSTPAEPSYLDYARWSAARPGRTELLERLTAALDGAPSDIALPYDRTGPHTDPARGTLVAFPLPPGTLRVVDELAATSDSTRFAVLAAAWCAFLARLSGQDDLVLGTPLANRTNPATAGLVGCFVNTLPLRVRVPGELSWAELAGSAAGAVAELLELQDVALEDVVSRLRQAGGDALPYQSCFVVQDGKDTGVRPQWSPPRRWPVKFDLTLSLEVAGEAVQGFLEARSDRLDDATVQLWARWFVGFVEALTADPGTPLQALDWHPEQPPVTARGPRNGSIDPLQGFLRQVRTGPGRPAVSTPAGRWTRAELAALTTEVLDELAAAGVVEGDRVALAIADPARRIAAELACLAAGAAFVPLDVSQPDGRRARILEAAAVRAVLSDQPARPPAALPAPAVRFRAVDPALPAYVMFTSGSTGTPKGVVIDRGALAAHVASYDLLLSVNASDVCSHLASPAFDAAIGEVMPALAAGAQVVTPPAEVVADTRALLGWLAEAGVTVAFAPTPLGELLLAELERDSSATPPALRVLYVGGAQLRRRPPPGPFRMLNLYGPTETTVAATWAEVSAEGWGLPPIGTPLAGATVHVLGEDGAPCGLGEPGELYIGGDKVGSGYLNDPERTRAAFVPSPDGDGSVAYRTGDLVRWRSDGSLDYLGRLDRQVQLRGVRVEPAEVEAALLRLPGVRQAHAAPLASAAGADPVLAAWLVVDEPQGEAARRRVIAAELPAAMVPARIAELAAFPLTVSGKIDTRALQQLLPAVEDGQEGEDGRAGREGNDDPMVGWWTATFGTLLGRAVGPDTDFFAAGGHSLLAARALALAREELGIDLRVHQMFATPTARQLAEATLDAAELTMDPVELTLDPAALAPDPAALAPDPAELAPGADALNKAERDPAASRARRSGEVAS